ncbi:beta-propeller domain-containing protein [Mumia sp. ZJ1417]|uniref:beta-propeller domain-containing protein n=1 Tax=Mumia sp. ZJ1417 TaxID=2708082 RepID=UPI00141DD8C2|nr:beta-propeller domain-containing protein [Mumia sp. ZJ1417]QMW65127.1 beta-propeller domain-containing protein [Mumia sp. ZJ1417]
MTDDDLDRRLRALRPPTPADDGWAESGAGERLLARVRAATAVSASRGHAPRAHRLRFGLAAVAVAAVATVAVSLPGGVDAPPPRSPGGDVAFAGARPVAHTLSASDSCDALLADLRAHAVKNVDAYDPFSLYVMPVAALEKTSGDLGASAKGTPAHSTTNNQEVGVDEPDVVKTDGARLVSITGGVLRITDVESRTVVGTLNLTAYAGAESASLLVDGDRALVTLGASGSVALGPAVESRFAAPGPPSSLFVLVDLSGKAPRVLSMLRPDGGLVDARLVDGRVRLVVRSAADITLPTLRQSEQSDATRRDVLAKAPLDAWLPSYEVTTGGESTTTTVPCTSVVRPPDYTGASLVTVYTVDLGADSFGGLSPVTLTADGATAYASPTSLYLTSSDTAPAAGSTEVHRFDLARSGKPLYLGSGKVAGQVLDSYSLSEYDGTLRVVTTSGSSERSRATSVSALDADTLAARGSVGGLGKGEDVYGVRFVGPYAYLVTFRQIDPLYVVDLSDPARPVASGELKITGYSDYLHVVGDGRLLGVGMDATRRGRTTGAQVSLFDVAEPTRPALLSRLLHRHKDSSDVADPHAFLWWEATRTAFVPLRDWTGDGRTEILAVRVDGDSLRELGTLSHQEGANPYDGGIRRALVIGDTVWTLSDGGLQLNAVDDLTREGRISFD